MPGKCHCGSEHHNLQQCGEPGRKLKTKQGCQGKGRVSLGIETNHDMDALRCVSEGGTAFGLMKRPVKGDAPYFTAV